MLTEQRAISDLKNEIRKLYELGIICSYDDEEISFLMPSEDTYSFKFLGNAICDSCHEMSNNVFEVFVNGDFKFNICVFHILEYFNNVN